MRSLVIGALALASLVNVAAVARDGRQWDDTPQDVREWFVRQKQPDFNASCCGPADAYEADGVSVVVDADGVAHVFAIITDERDDAKLGRPHVDVGTRIEIPPNKNNDTRADPNPSGHGIVFVRSGQVGLLLHRTDGSLTNANAARRAD